MQVPVQITIRDHIPHSDAIDTHIKEKIAAAEQYCDKLIACHVVLELENKNHSTGNLYNTRITASVPGKEFVSTHNVDENLYTSIKVAFEDLWRQLEEHNRQEHRKSKHHAAVLSGVVARLIEEEAEPFGFIEGTDGTEYYFNAANLTTGSFDKVAVGMPVHFIEFTGHEGLQAHRVKLLKENEE